MDASTDEREVRAARNQAIFRALNEKIVEMNKRLGDFETLDISCECADVSCAELLSIGSEEYASVRRSPRTFAVLADHVFPDVERVVSRKDGYAVVEVTGQGIEVAEATHTTGPDGLGTSG